MDFRLPDLGEGIHDAELVEWKVAAEDQVHRGDDLAEVMTDKAVIDLPSPFSGTISELFVAAGSTVSVDDRLLSYTSDDATETHAAPPEVDGTAGSNGDSVESDSLSNSSANAPSFVTTTPKQESSGVTDPAVKAIPAVRQLAKRLAIDLNEVTGSGPDGRILIDDFADHILATQSGKTPSAAIAKEMPAEPPQSGKRIPFRGVRRRIAERMVHAKRTIPHYSYVDECDVTQLVRARDALRDTLAKENVRITYLPFFVRAVAKALRDVPFVNSSLDEDRDEIVLHDHINIGIATATEQGLVVPVLRNADAMSLEQAAREITRVSTDAKSGRINAADLGGSTFTITSIGGIGGLISTPIINHPEVAILGIGRIIQRPVWDVVDKTHAANIVYLSFSFDHRVVDGAVGAEFGNAVIGHLQ